MKYRYAVLSYIVGKGYEKEHPILVKDEDCDYVMVVDDPDYKSDSYRVVYDPELSGTPFNKVLQIRYNPFKYTDAPIVIKIDGSMQVVGSLKSLVDKFEKDSYDISICMHPTRVNLYDEMVAWVQQRNVPVEEANKCLSFLAMYEGYDVKNHKGLYQLNYSIQRNDRVNNDLNRITYAFCKYLSPTTTNIDNDVMRVDQIVFSAVLNKYFSNIKVMPFDERINHSQFFKWYSHNSDIPYSFGGVETLCKPYLFNKPLHNQIRPQDL